MYLAVTKHKHYSVLSQQCPGSVPSCLLVPLQPPSRSVQEDGKLKCPWLCAVLSSYNEITVLITHCFFLLKLKHRIIADSVKKINSVQTDTRQAETQNVVRMTTWAL